MIFARKVWRLLVAVKDGLALLALLLFFGGLYMVLTLRPNAGAVHDGALLLKLDGSVVEEPEQVDLATRLLSSQVPTNQYAVRDLVRAIETGADDARIKAVVLDLSRFTGGGQVHMEAIGAALDKVRAAKKPVFTFAQAYTDDGVLLAAHSSEAWVDPLGGAVVTGPGGNALYYAALLEKLKINVHIFRVGTYKDYVEPYFRNDMSPAAKEARTAIYAALWDNYRADVAKARPRANLDLVTRDPAGWLQASGGDPALAAKAAGLVDRIGDKAQFGARVAAVVGKDTADKLPGSYAHSTLRAWLAANAPKTSGKTIAVVTIAGEIVDGKAGPGSAGGDRIAALLDKAAQDKPAGLVIRVDSPGGSVTASEVIRRALVRIKARGIPVAVSMGNVAASGGYWVATPATRIFAQPATITGSIGIFAVVPSFERALASVGVNGDGVRTTPLSGQPDLFSGFTPEIEAMLQTTVENGYARFVGLVAQARGKTPQAIDTIAQGRVWDGGTARQIGLVDQFGGLDDALAWTAAQAKLGAGEWHPEYLGSDKRAYASLIERLTGNDDGADTDPSGGEDFAMIVARGQQDQLGRALNQVERLVSGGGGVQAYCLECASAEPSPASRAQGTGILRRAARLLADWFPG